MSAKDEIKPGCSKELITPKVAKEDYSHECDVGTVDEAKTDDARPVLDQIIIAPEIMSMILEHLDFKSLKTVRLVCKSWLREAQEHLQEKGLVFLYSKGESGAQSFIQIRQQESQALPQAFRCMDVDLLGIETCTLLWPHVSSLCPPLVISRFSPWHIPFELAFRLVIQFASSLEFLMLFAKTSEKDYKPMLDPKLHFPKLQHLHINGQKCNENPRNWIHFPSTIAWIVGASPNLKTYESWCGFGNSRTLASELFLQVDIKSVKELLLAGYVVNREAFDHFLSIPLSQLQKLKLDVIPEGGSDENPVAVIATVAKSTHTHSFTCKST